MNINQTPSLTTYYDAPFEDGILNIFSTEHPNEKQVLNLFIVYAPNSGNPLSSSLSGVIKTVIKVYNLKDLEPSDIVDFAFAYVRFMLPTKDDANECRH